MFLPERHLYMNEKIILRRHLKQNSGCLGHFALDIVLFLCIVLFIKLGTSQQKHIGNKNNLLVKADC